MLIAVFATFLVTTGLYGLLAWLALRSVTAHLKDKPEAARALVILLMGGRTPEDKKPKSSEARLC
jgi:hypothetical protein